MPAINPQRPAGSALLLGEWRPRHCTSGSFFSFSAVMFSASDNECAPQYSEARSQLQRVPDRLRAPISLVFLRRNPEGK